MVFIVLQGFESQTLNFELETQNRKSTKTRQR